jgi:hypothetical protein
LADFPLPIRSDIDPTDLDRESVLDFMEELIILTDNTSRLLEHNEFLTALQGPAIDSDPVHTMQPTSSITGESKKPVVTLASALPKISYSEQNETNGSERTLEYVKVQRALLKYMETRASDTLSPRQARQWTQAIDPTGNKRPKAADALKLCYYMRSQGYDVYGTIEDQEILLRVVTLQGTHALYWVQSIVTNAVTETDAAAPRTSRRNAMVDVDILNELQAAPVGPQTTRSADLVAAEARLQVLLEDPRANPE